ncbi:zinc ABC transporter substrate-binding protein [Yoonia sp. 208BN28-4]|uniref:zinc ABC transporter substrate-binding protein n=1 Tax=Yoonia sp. 208BN28-4 TaxID=3126505 RepID=UPI0030A27512
MIRTATAIALVPFAAQAEVPQVLTDFAPVYSLTAQVMDGVGTPQSLLPAGAEPHDYDLSPGDAANLAGADLLVWVGPAMTPWLAEPVTTLAPEARQIVLLETSGWEPLETRGEAVHDHDDHEGHSDHEGHEGHSDHADHDEHDDHEGHDDHADHDEHDDHADHDSQEDHEDHAGHDHDHGPIDPHAWVDPDIAAIWVGQIASALGEMDPDNAATYTANAQATQANLAALGAEIEMMLEGVTGTYILPHDGYQYFEARFDLPAAGAIAGSDAHAPGPARIAALQDMVQSGEVTCILTDRETDPAWATLLIEGTDARTAMIDATAADYPLGPEAYGNMMRKLAQTMADCLR